MSTRYGSFKDRVLLARARKCEFWLILEHETLGPPTECKILGNYGLWHDTFLSRSFENLLAQQHGCSGKAYRSFQQYLDWGNTL